MGSFEKSNHPLLKEVDKRVRDVSPGTQWMETRDSRPKSERCRLPDRRQHAFSSVAPTKGLPCQEWPWQLCSSGKIQDSQRDIYQISPQTAKTLWRHAKGQSLKISINKLVILIFLRFICVFWWSIFGLIFRVSEKRDRKRIECFEIKLFRFSRFFVFALVMHLKAWQNILGTFPHLIWGQIRWVREISSPAIWATIWRRSHGRRKCRPNGSIKLIN